MAQSTRSTNTAGGGTIVTGLLGFAAGAAVMYFFDPELGDGRRTQLADRVGGATRRFGRQVGGWSEDMTQELQAVPHEFRYRSSDEPVTDDVLASRVRSEIGHTVRHAGAIDVRVTDGEVTLSGPVLADEAVGLLATINTVPGVRRVNDRLDVHQASDSIPALQG